MSSYNNIDMFPQLRDPHGYPTVGGGSPESGFRGESENPLRDFMNILKKRWLLITLSGLGFGFIGLVFCLLSTPLYTATATLEIRGYAPALPDAQSEALYGLDTRRLDYNKTTTAKMTRRGIADRVLSEDGLTEEIRDYFAQSSMMSALKGAFRSGLRFIGLVPNKLPGTDDEGHYVHSLDELNKYLGLVTVTAVAQTSLIELSVTTSSPKLSQKIANAHARVFIDDLRRERQDSLAVNRKVLQTQADALKSRLTAAEQELTRYAEKNQLVAVSNSEDANVTVKHIVNLTQLLADATARRVRSESMLRELENKDPKSTPSVLDDDTQRDARIALQQAEVQYGSLINKVTPEYPAMVELRSRIQVLKSAIQSNYQRTLQGLRMQYESDRAAEDKLIAQINVEKGNAQEMSKRLVQYNLLLKESESLRQLYEAVLRQAEETQVSGASASSNIFVSDYAARPTLPSSPHTMIVVLVMGFLGLVAGCLAALSFESFSTRVSTPEDTAAVLALPFLGSVPSFESGESKQQRWKGVAGRVWKALPYVPETDAGEEKRLPAIAHSRRLPSRGKDMITIAPPSADVAEALRTIRTGIVLSSADNPPKVLMVTSVVKGEGKTTVASNLAASLAEAGHRTLLLDVDFRQAQIGRLFNVPAGTLGLVDYLIGQVGIDSVMLPTQIPNLQVITAGTLPPNPAELVGSKKMEGLIRNLREDFEYLILDTPPVLPVADAMMLTRITDAVLLVVRSNVTDRAQARDARNRLLRVRARILGIILNDFEAGSTQYSNYTRQSPDDDTQPFMADVA